MGYLNTPSFIVNLDKDQDRWAYVSHHMSKIGLPFERMPGVLGRTLSKAQLEQHYDPKRASWRQARQLTPAEIGCALSHARVYREISKRSLARALILEDDVILDPETLSVLKALEEHMPEHVPRVCLLSEATPMPSGASQRLVGARQLRSFQAGYFTSSYMVTRAAAELLLGALHPIGDVADCWRRLAQLKDLDIFIVAPPLSRQLQEDFGSSTTKDIQISLGTSFPERLRYKLFRTRNILLGPLVDAKWRGSVYPIEAAQSHPIDSLQE